MLHACRRFWAARDATHEVTDGRPQKTNKTERMNMGAFGWAL